MRGENGVCIPETEVDYAVLRCTLYHSITEGLFPELSRTMRGRFMWMGEEGTDFTGNYQITHGHEVVYSLPVKFVLLFRGGIEKMAGVAWQAEDGQHGCLSDFPVTPQSIIEKCWPLKAKL